MFNKIKVLLVILISGLIVFGLSCTSKPTLPIDPYKGIQEKLTKTPRPNREVEEIALWLSKDFAAPDDLYNRIDTSLAYIRKQYSDSIPQIDSIRFIYPKQPSYIIVKLTKLSAKQYKENLIHEWDFLNDLFHLRNIEPNRYFTYNQKVNLNFKGIVNPDSLAVLYQQLDAVSNASPSYYNGDWSCIYPWIREDGKLTFLLRKAWGNCSYDCKYSYFWYFVESDSGWNLIGEWEWDPSQSYHLPSWWKEARVAWRKYY